MAEPTIDIDRTRDAVRRESWAEAYEGLRTYDPSELTPHDLEGLADAAWWLSKREESIAARRDAYAGHASARDDRRAASTALRLFAEHFFGREPAEATGWLMRAQRHLQSQPEEVEHGYLALGRAYMAHVSQDLDEAEAQAERATVAGQRFHDPDLIALGIDAHGRTLISRGMVAKGASLLDEAMTSVVAGELSSFVTGTIYCNVLDACLELADLGRAAEWSNAAAAWCESLPPDAPFIGLCRLARVQLATFQGAWGEAQAEALRASGELAFLPQAVGAAFASTGEIRLRSGNLAGAEEAFARARDLGFDPQPGLALLRLVQGKQAAALTGLRVALSAESPSPLNRARLLGATVEVALSAGEIDEAQSASDELDTIAQDSGAPALDAAAATARGAVRLAQGSVHEALESLRFACRIWQELRLPYETARARMLYGVAVRMAGDEEDARLEISAAMAEFERLGAAPDAGRAAALLGERRDLPRGLTLRQAEVLRLVAAGKTNRDVASELVISEHTVARHLQNIYAKLEVSSRTAATAFAVEHGLA